MQSFIFGGDTGVDYETLQRRRAVVDAMQKRGTGIARNLGEGIGVLGNAVFGKIASNRLDKQEAAGRKSASEAFEAAFSASRQRRAQAQAPTPAPQAFGEVQTEPLGAVDPVRSNVMKALIQQESGGNPSAVSPKGAGGLAQIMPATARDPGYGVPSVYDMAVEMGNAAPPPPEAGDEAMTAWLADPTNAGLNEKFGTMYYDAMLQKNGGDQSLALASYNAGPGAVDKYGDIPPYEETQNYVKAINDRLSAQENRPKNSGISVSTEVDTPSRPRPRVTPGHEGGGSSSIDPALMKLAGNQFLTPQQQNVVQAMLQQQIGAMNPNEMDALKTEQLRLQNDQLRNPRPTETTPYQTAQLELQNRRLEAQLSGQLKTGNSVTIDNKAESAFEVESAKATAKMLGGMTENGVAARGELAQITELEGFLDQGVGGTADTWKAWAQDTLGVNIGAGGQVEAFSALINKLVPQQRPPGSGQMSDRDVQLFKSSLPQLVNSPEGNRLILETMRGMANFKRAQGEIAQQVMIGRMSREEGLTALYELPDPLAEFREARPSVKGGEGDLPDDPAAIRKELEALRNE